MQAEVWKNLPEDLESAVERIKLLERTLEDLDRAIEIAIAMRQFNLVDSICADAKELLKTKIDLVHDEDKDPIKIVLVTDKSKKPDAETA